MHLRIKIAPILLLLNILALVLVAAIVFYLPDIVRVIAGLPFILFFPGYVLVLALFPRKGVGDRLQRIVLSFGLSIVVALVIGLVLNYTRWGITPESVSYSVAFFIFIASLTAWFRQRGLAEEEQYILEFHPALSLRGGGVLDKALTIGLLCAVIGTVGALGYTLFDPKVEERFTDFYLLGLEGQASNYPKELTVGAEGKVIIGIVNREQEEISYRVTVEINQVKCNEIGPIVLQHNEKREEIISFSPKVTGDKQKVEFLLYMNVETEPYSGPLRLWLDVK